MLVQELLRKSAARLGVESELAFLECELVLAFSLGFSREKLFVFHDRNVNSDEEQRFLELFARLKDGEPLAYILQCKEFYGLEFSVDPRVMIPRPETEMLVSEVLKICGQRDEFGIFVDVGTGSGNIAVALAVHLEWARIFALDVSDEALEVAAYNVEKHGVGDRVKVMQSDLLNGIIDSRSGVPRPRSARARFSVGNYKEKFSRARPLPVGNDRLLRSDRSLPILDDIDIIVANLPYIGTKQHHYVARGVRNFEPNQALFGGEDGLELYRRLLEQISFMGKLPRYVIGEIGFSQGEMIREEIFKTFPRADIQIQKDLAGLDRMFVAVLGNL